MFKKCKVVMLTTNEKAQIHITPRGYMHKSVEAFIPAFKVYKSYHLYITSDDIIKEGDWYIWNNLDNIPTLCLSQRENLNSDNSKKIIATTDSSLGYTDHRITPVPKFCYYPQPSQSFIEKYITEYNKGNIITDVLVEYEDYILNQSRIGLPNIIQSRPKVNPKDNTITIKKIKDSWTREEVIELLYKKDLYGNCNTDEEFANWIDENI